MDNLSISDKKRFIFGYIIVIASKLHMVGDNYLSEDNMTLSQWFLSTSIAQFGYSPTLKEVAESMSTSHQNVKQLALKLQKKGFLDIVKDEEDKRAIRLVLTQKSNDFWDERTDKDNQFLKELFEDLDEKELDIMYRSVYKIYDTLIKLSDKYK